jgi:hypothetical protein
MPEESLDDLQELLEALAKVPEVVEEVGVFVREVREECEKSSEEDVAARWWM